MLKAVLSAPSAPLPGTSLYILYIFLCHFDLEISIQKSRWQCKDRQLGNQLTSPWLLQTKARSSSRTTVGSPPVTKLLACTFQLISFFHLWTELTLTLDEPRQYLEKSDILQTKAILILDPYPLFWLLSVIAPVFSFCFSSEIFQENVWCILLTKLLQKHFWLLCNGRLSM